MKLKATTLLEVILYLALFGMIFSAVVLFTISVNQNNVNNDQRARVEKTAIFVNEHLFSSFNKATTLDSPNSTFDDDNGRLRINYAGGYYEYRINWGIMEFSDNSVNNNLSDSDVTIDKFLVEAVLDASTNVKGIRVTLEIASAKTPRISKETTTFYILN